MYVNLALIRVFLCICQIVHDDLLHTLSITLDRIIIIHVCSHIHIHTCRTTVFHSTDRPATHIIHVASANVHTILTAFHIGDVKNVVHQCA